jgi:hypothetical protein
MHHVITTIQEAVENRKLHLSTPRYWGSFWYHFMWHHRGCQMAWFVDTIVMGWLHAGWQKNYSHTHRRNAGRVCVQVLSAEGHFIAPYLWSLVVDELIEELNVNGCYTLGYVLSSSVQNSQILSHSFFRRLSIEQQWCGKTQISIYPHKPQHLDQYLMKTGHLDKIR